MNATTKKQWVEVFKYVGIFTTRFIGNARPTSHIDIVYY